MNVFHVPFARLKYGALMKPSGSGREYENRRSMRQSIVIGVKEKHRLEAEISLWSGNAVVKIDGMTMTELTPGSPNQPGEARFKVGREEIHDVHQVFLWRLFSLQRMRLQGGNTHHWPKILMFE